MLALPDPSGFSLGRRSTFAIAVDEVALEQHVMLHGHRHQSFFTCNTSPTRTSREALAGWPLDRILPSSHALAASERVLKNLAALSHSSIRTQVMIHSHINGVRPAAVSETGCPQSATTFVKGH